MWFRKRQACRQARESVGVVCEAMEGRQLFAGAPAGFVAYEPPARTPVQYVAVQHSTNEAPAPSAGKAVQPVVVSAAKKPRTVVNAQDLYGVWQGTFRGARAKVDSAFGANFYLRHAQRPATKVQAFTGTFDLSAMVGQSNAVTTVTMGRDHNVRISIKTPTATVSFTGGLSMNGEQIIGRYSTQIGRKFEVGTFVMNKVK